MWHLSATAQVPYANPALTRRARVQALVAACMHADYRLRPNIESIAATLEGLLAAEVAQR